MDETHYRDGNVVLFRRSDSKKYQARIKLDNGKGVVPLSVEIEQCLTPL